MKTLIKKVISKAFVASVMLGVSLSTLACDLHDQPSFGTFGSMSNYGQSHPLMQRHLAQAKVAPLSITHARKVLNDVEEKASVDIKYHLPANYKNVSLSFTHSDGIELGTNEEIKIDELNGTYTLHYVPRKSGKHHILVWADATRQTLPYSIVQRIDLVVN